MFQLPVGAARAVRRNRKISTRTGCSYEPFEPSHGSTRARASDGSEAEAMKETRQVLPVPVLTDQHDDPFTAVNVDEGRQAPMPKNKNDRLPLHFELSEVLLPGAMDP